MTKKSIIIFTRYPKQGKVKSRLIPEIGVIAATSLQKEMTELAIYEAVQSNENVQIHYNGASLNEIQTWIFSLEDKFNICDLQKKIGFTQQSDGDLGHKMEQSFRVEFAKLFQGKKNRAKVLLIGCDCPNNREENLQKAFDLLENHACVLGPSLDGGYYMVGLAANSLPELEKIYTAIFQNMTWGNSEVLPETLTRLAKANIKTAQVALLNDVDLLEDIPAKISLIVPMLNEEKNLEQLAKNIYPSFNYEIILVDGGSSDQSIALGEKLGFTVISSKKGRSAQIINGAKKAKGEILLFLHADCILPKNWDMQVRNILESPANSLGYFLFDIYENFGAKNILIPCTNFRARYFQLPYGDQGLFVRKKDFEAWNLPEVPILEDVFLVKKAKKMGKIVCTNTKLQTSGRRWIKHGMFKTSTLNHLVMLGAKLNMDLEILKEAYLTAQNPFLLYFKKKFRK